MVAPVILEPGLYPGVDPGFWSGAPSKVLTLRGALSPKFAQNRGFPLKLPENCMVLKKSWGQGGPGPPRAPWIRYCHPMAAPVIPETGLYLEYDCGFVRQN